jgi:hypothetical protein
MLRQAVLAFSILGLLLQSACALGDDYSYGPEQAPGYLDRKDLPDSFKYYGPQGIWKKLAGSPTLRLGRDTWFFWTGGAGQGGTQHFYRALSVNSSKIALQGKIQFYHLMQMSRQDRWEKLGLINEPNCVESTDPDPVTKLKLDKWLGDPEPNSYYPTSPEYGESTGVVGLRKFKNPKFDPGKWDVQKYYDNPGSLEPPHLVGITCAFCHVAFDPLNPPANAASPRWENLAANIGNQYLHEGGLFFGEGRLFSFRSDSGLSDSDLVWHYGETQQRGTSETSRFSYDFINNPNTINAVFYVGQRRQFYETTPHGIPQRTLHVLKDGSDSVGLEMGLERVFVNIGMEGQYWIDHLWNPVTGRKQRPFLLDEIRLTTRADELKAQFGDDFGKSWAATEQRVPALIAYLSQYQPMHLRDAPGGARYLLDPSKPGDAERLRRGKIAFADNCAYCHSNKRPYYLLANDDEMLRSEADLRKRYEQVREFFENSVLADNFLDGNTLSSDQRHPLTLIQTNAARALAKNAVEGDIWADFSSKEYKALPPVGILNFPRPWGGAPFTFQAPGGGRGYYRPASLVSLWATAPYLHNNSVGPLTSDPAKRIPDPSVAERVRLFQLSIEQMLWPEKRTPAVKVTSKASQLLPPQVIRRILHATLAEFLASDVDRLTAEAVKEGILTAEEAARIHDATPPFLQSRLQNYFDGARATTQALLKAIRQQEPAVTEAVRQELGKLVLDPKVLRPESAEKLRRLVDLSLPLAVDRGLNELESLAALEVTIPAGFPINLLLNLDTDKLPYVTYLLVKFRDQPTVLGDQLLLLSDCPDLIENHGHTFGGNLSDAEKRDLIEFLKTF